MTCGPALSLWVRFTKLRTWRQNGVKGLHSVHAKV